MSRVYLPAHETQTDQGAPVPWTNCTFAAGAMLVDWWTWGRQLTSDVALRARSGIPVARGANYAALRAATAAELRMDLRYSEPDGSGNANISWRQLLEHLRTGGASCVAGDYAALAGHTTLAGVRLDRWQPGGDFGHNMLAVAADDDTVLILDPLGRGGYEGDRAPIGALWEFIYKSGWADADVRVAAAHGFAGARPPFDPAAAREQRLAIEVVRRRREQPKEAALWQSATGLHIGNRGKPLERIQYLAGEALFLRRADPE